MEDSIITQTTNWIKSVVVGCNFCPFAAKALIQKSIRYVVLTDTSVEECLQRFVEELEFLDKNDEIETTFIIFENDFSDFEDYLELVDLAEELAFEQDYEGIYQVASFHPDYCFEDAHEEDPANFTNRSVYPMLHILREESVSKALDHFPDAEDIPQRNIDFAREKGWKYMQMLRAACL
jgi:uncharacterized protein